MNIDCEEAEQVFKKEEVWDGKHAAIRALKFQGKKKGLAITSCSVVTVLMEASITAMIQYYDF